MLDFNAEGIAVSTDFGHVHRLDLRRQYAEITRCDSAKPEADLPFSRAQVVDKEDTFVVVFFPIHQIAKVVIFGLFIALWSRRGEGGIF